MNDLTIAHCPNWLHPTFGSGGGIDTSRLVPPVLSRGLSHPLNDPPGLSVFVIPLVVLRIASQRLPQVVSRSKHPWRNLTHPGADCGAQSTGCVLLAGPALSLLLVVLEEEEFGLAVSS